MENRRILNRRSWSSVPKGLLIGALTGLVFTLLPLATVIVTGVESTFVLGAVLLTIYFPTTCVYLAFGLELPYAAGGRHAIWGFLILVTIVNTLVGASLGATVGYLIRLLKSRKDSSNE